MNVMLPNLVISVSKTMDGQHDYLQITSEDQFAINVVLVANKIKIKDKRDR